MKENARLSQPNASGVPYTPRPENDEVPQSSSGGTTSLLDRWRRTARTWAINTRNTATYLLSGGRKTVHEGRYERWRGTWTNWSRTFEAQPQRFERPETEADICSIVRASSKLRVVAAGHSFNASPLTSGTMLSLDRYDQILSVDMASRVVHVQAGVRLRDLTEYLQKLGLALPVLGSTNAQSVGGLIATDLHGTGRDHGFLSEQILSLDSTEIFAEAEAIFARYGGQPHLGKKTSATSASMAELYKARWARFCEVRRQQDPGGKFLNDFGSLFQVDEDVPARESAAA